jgi:hypothetical protein
MARLLELSLCFRAIFSMIGRKRIARRLIEEWSTATPRSSIMFSRCRKLSG